MKNIHSENRDCQVTVVGIAATHVLRDFVEEKIAEQISKRHFKTGTLEAYESVLNEINRLERGF